MTVDASDGGIIAASRARPERFAEIFDRHYAEIHRYVDRRLGADAADDIAAETFLIAFRGRGRFDVSRDSARPWLYGIATNLIGRHRRSESRRYRAMARLENRDVSEGHEDRVVSAVAAGDGRLSAALAGLAHGDRDVLLLVALGELSYPEVAQALAAADGTAKSPSRGSLWYRKSSIGETVVVRSPIRPGVKYTVQVEQDDHVLASPDKPLPEPTSHAAPGGQRFPVLSASWPGDKLTVRPASAADAAEWEADGKPDAGDLHVGEPSRSIGPEMGGGPVLDFGVEGARRLPADPAKLRAALLNYAVKVGHTRVPNPDEYLYRGASFLLVDEPIDDDVRIATYRLLASLRGVRTVTATDANGRQRQGVALRTTTKRYGTVDSELLIDSGTGRLVASQEVVVTPGTRNASLRPGDRWHYEIVRQAGWTNQSAESLLPADEPPPAGPDEP
ncbi:sigma-70 family RNA polymerase sigma factor [Spirillospora sp. NPDC052269]